MSDNLNMSSKSDKAAGNAAEDDATLAETLKFVMIVFERQNPGFPIQGWADIAEKASISLATAKQRWAKTRDEFLEQMKDNVPVRPVTKTRKSKKRARASPEEDDETPVTKKNKQSPESTGAEPHVSSENDSSDDSPARAVAKRVSKAANKSRVRNSKDKINAVACPSPVPASTTSATSVPAPVTRGRKSNRRVNPDPEEDIEDDGDDVSSKRHVTGRPSLFANLPVPSQQPVTDKKGRQEKNDKGAGSAESKRNQRMPLPTLEDKRRREQERRRQEKEEEEEEEEKRQAALALLTLRSGHSQN